MVSRLLHILEEALGPYSIQEGSCLPMMLSLRACQNYGPCLGPLYPEKGQALVSRSNDAKPLLQLLEIPT